MVSRSSDGIHPIATNMTNGHLGRPPATPGATLTNSLRRSSSSRGIRRRSTCPSGAGLSPRLESTIALPLPSPSHLSETCTDNMRGSGTLIVAILIQRHMAAIGRPAPVRASTPTRARSANHPARARGIEWPRIPAFNRRYRNYPTSYRSPSGKTALPYIQPNATDQLVIVRRRAPLRTAPIERLRRSETQ